MHIKCVYTTNNNTIYNKKKIQIIIIIIIIIIIVAGSYCFDMLSSKRSLDQKADPI